jgi:mannosyltransferase OCH1-like enzyme
MSIKTLLFPPLNSLPRRSLLEPVEAGTSIPRVIHQTFYERKLSDRLQANVDHLRAMNPGWEYRFYDDHDIAEFIKAQYPRWVGKYFERIDPRYGAARADLFRYLLMYKVGGLYLDIKSTATRPLDSVLKPDDRFILSQWYLPNGQFEHSEGFIYDLRHIPGGEFQQWHILCAPGHPFMKAVIEAVLANIDAYDPYLHQTGKRGVLRVTGPIAYTLAIRRIMADHPHRDLDGRNEIGLEYNVFGEMNHVKVFKSHYSMQTAPIVRLGPFKRLMSGVYGVAQYLHDRVRDPAKLKAQKAERLKG